MTLTNLRNSRKITFFTLIFIAFLFTSCSGPLEDNTDASAITESPTAVPALNPTGTPAPTPTVEPTVVPAPEPTAAPTQDPTAEPTIEPSSESVAGESSAEITYVLNTSSRKIHHANCNSVAKIKPENYATTDKSVEELLEEGYTKCGNCW